MNSGRYTVFLVMFLTLVFALLVLFGKNYVLNQMERERHLTANVLGSAAEQSIYSQAYVIYDALFKKTGVMKASFNLIAPTDAQRARSGGLENFGEAYFSHSVKRLTVFWNSLFQATYRAVLMFHWLPYMLPLFLPAIIDGLMTREIKKHNYGYASAVRYHMGIHFLITVFLIVPIYLLMPFAITPLAIPAIGFLQAIILMFTAANLQKQI